MSEFPSLAEVLIEHSRHGSLNCKCRAAIAPDGGYPDRPTIEQHQADAWRSACEVRTVEQLDALPHGSLLVRHYTSAAGWKLHEVWERRNDEWYCLAAPLNPPGHEFGTPILPALLIWTPAWGRP